MKTYRFFCLDEKGRARKCVNVECATDEQAIGIAGRQTGLNEGIEIWDGRRLVYQRRRPGTSEKANALHPSAILRRG
jgi:hypothetical protein